MIVYQTLRTATTWLKINWNEKHVSPTHSVRNRSPSHIEPLHLNFCSMFALWTVLKMALLRLAPLYVILTFAWTRITDNENNNKQVDKVAIIFQ